MADLVPLAVRAFRLRARWGARRMTALVAVLAALAIVVPARADLPRLPGPIELTRLGGVMDLVGASADQRRAVEALHAAYARGYATRRQAIIDAATPADESPMTLGNDPGAFRSREAIRLQRLRQRWQVLRGIDDAFDAEVRTLFDASVHPRLAAAWADRRDAAWLELAGNGLTATGMDVSLAELVAGLIPMDDPRRVELEPVLDAAVATWRSRRSRLVDAWATASMELRRSVAARLEPGGVEQDFLALRDAWHGSQAEVLAAAVVLARHHRAAVEGLARQLPPDLAIRLRSRWRAVDAPSPIAADGPLATWLDEALERLEKLEASPDAGAGPDPDVASALRAADRTHRARLNALARDLAASAEIRDRSEAGYQTRYQLAGEPDRAELAAAAWREAEREAAAERDAIDDLTRGSLEAIRAMPGAALLGLRSLPEPRAAGIAEVPERRSVSIDADGVMEMSVEGMKPEVLAEGWGFGRSTRRQGFLPRAVAASEAIDWARRLGIPAENDPIVGALHADYTDRWRTIRSEGAAGRADRLARDFFVRSADGTVQIPEFSECVAVLESRRAAFDELAVVDDSLLEELLVLSPLDESARAVARADIAADRAIARLRSVLTATSSDRFSRRVFLGGDDEPRIEDLRLDLEAIVDRAFDGEPPADVAALIVAWKAELMPVLDAMVDAHRRERRGQIQRLLGALERAEDGTLTVGSIRFPATLPEDDPQRRWMDSAKVLWDLHRASLERLRATAPESAAAAIEDSVWRARFPGNFRLPPEAEDAYRVAVFADRLAPEARAEIEGIWADYVASWDVLARRLSEAGDDWEARSSLFTERESITEAMAAAIRLRLEG